MNKIKPTKFNYDLYMSREDIERYDKKMMERKDKLESHPEYLKIANRLDTLLITGNLEKMMEKIDKAALKKEKDRYPLRSYFHNELLSFFSDFKNKEIYNSNHQDILINIGIDLWEIIKDCFLPMEMSHIGLELYRIGWDNPKMYMCVAEELRNRGYEFNIYGLKEEDIKEDN